MSQRAWQVEPFDPEEAGSTAYQALNAFENRIRAEEWPEDRPRDVEETQRQWCSTPPFLDKHAWAIWRGEQEIAALGEAEVNRTQDNQHMVWFEMAVVPEMRRRGMAKVLLQPITEVARREGRRLLVTVTSSAIPAGAAFMERLGAQSALVMRTSQLNLEEVDRDLIRCWQEIAPQEEFDVGLWEGAYPEQNLETVVRMKNVMNTAPRDDLKLEDRQWTAEQLRQIDSSLRKRGIERWTLYARHRESAEVAGYTEVFWNPKQPETLQQGDTGVFPEYRGRKLGRWLKAAMLEKVRRDRPEVRRIRTGNANSNAAMLKINVEMGFKPYKSSTVWQVELDQALEYLGDRAR